MNNNRKFEVKFGDIKLENCWFLKKIRKVVVLRDDDWQEIPFEQLKNGDTFRMYEPTGEPILNEAGTVFHKATSEPFLKDGIWAIEAVPLKLVAK